MWLVGEMLLVDVDDFLDFVLGADEKWHALMNRGWLDVEDSHLSGRGQTAGLLDYVGHRVALVHESEFAVRRVFGGWVRKDTAVHECSVKVSNHRADVPASWK